jgi:hypothetical protein
MGTERLKDAERAAGFAMAVDEAEDAGKLERKPEAETWQSGEAILLQMDGGKPVKTAGSMTDWVKGVVSGMLGRGAPA